MESEQNKSRRGIYLLPNLFTTGALFAGFYAIVAAMGGRFEAAAIAVFVAMLLDGLDGRVARITNTSSEFGAEYDSLSDMVSFGLAPSLVMYEWALVHMNGMGWVWAKLGWLAAFFYAAAAALRLARFNIRSAIADKRYFQGLPSPSAAALLMGMIWVWHDLEFSGDQLKVPAFLLTVTAGALMVSKFSYYSFKDPGSPTPHTLHRRIGHGIGLHVGFDRPAQSVVRRIRALRLVRPIAQSRQVEAQAYPQIKPGEYKKRLIGYKPHLAKDSIKDIVRHMIRRCTSNSFLPASPSEAIGALSPTSLYINNLALLRLPQ